MQDLKMESVGEFLMCRGKKLQWWNMWESDGQVSWVAKEGSVGCGNEIRMCCLKMWVRVGVEKFSKIQKDEEGFEGEKLNFAQDVIFSVELVKLLQDRSCSTGGSVSGDDVGSRDLDHWMVYAGKPKRRGLQ